MRREPWSLVDLLLVINHPELGDDELVTMLGDRGDIGTGVIRIGLHTYHVNDTGPAQRLFLPQLCREYLARTDRPEVVCPKCGVRF